LSFAPVTLASPEKLRSPFGKALSSSVYRSGIWKVEGCEQNICQKVAQDKNALFGIHALWPVAPSGHTNGHLLPPLPHKHWHEKCIGEAIQANLCRPLPCSP
jgi:hypothetical protein